MSINLNRGFSPLNLTMETKRDLAGNETISDEQFEVCLKKGNEIYLIFLKKLQKIREENCIFNQERFDLPKIFTFFVMNHIFDSTDGGLWKFDEDVIYHSETTGLCHIRTTKSFISDFVNEDISDVGFEGCYYQLNNMLEDFKMSKFEAIVSIGYSILANRIPEKDMMQLINYFSKNREIDDFLNLKIQTRISKSSLRKEVLLSLFIMEDYELDFYTREYLDYSGPRYDRSESWEYFTKNKVPIFLMRSFLYFILMVGLKDLIIHWVVTLIMILGHLIFVFGMLDKFIYNYYIGKVMVNPCWSRAIPKFKHLSRYNGTQEIYINAFLMGDFRHITVSTKPDPEMITLCKMTYSIEPQRMRFKYKIGYELILFIFSEKIVSDGWILSEYTNNTSVYDLEFYTVPFEYRSADICEVLALKASINDLFDVDYNMAKNDPVSPISKHKNNAITSCINKFKKENNIFFKGQISRRFDGLYEKFKARVYYLLDKTSKDYPMVIENVEVPMIEFMEEVEVNYDFEKDSIINERAYLDQLELEANQELEREQNEIEEVEWEDDDYEDIEEVSDEEVECLNSAEEKHKENMEFIKKSRDKVQEMEEKLEERIKNTKSRKKILYFEPKFRIDEKSPKMVFNQDCSNDMKNISKAISLSNNSRFYNMIMRSTDSILKKIPNITRKSEIHSIKNKVRRLIRDYNNDGFDISKLLSPGKLYDKLLELISSETKIKKQALIKTLKIGDKKHQIQKEIVKTYKKKIKITDKIPVSANINPFRNENNIKLYNVFNLLRNIMPFGIFELHPQLMSALSRSLFKRNKLKVPSNFLKNLTNLYQLID